MVTPAEAATELLRRRRARNDLVSYANAIEIPGAPVGDDDSWIFKPVETSVAVHHRVILNTLDDVFSGKIKRVMFFLPPGSAKSTYASVVAPTYFLGKYPNSKIILASYASDLAKRFGRRARQIVQSAGWKPIFNTKISSITSAADEWALENSSEFLAGGILSGITGNRANGIIIDDPIKGRQDADSEVVRKRTFEAYQDDLLTRLVPGGWQVIIQTRWHEDDLSGRILPQSWSGESGDILCRDGEIWRVVCIQALCEKANDPAGRKVGEYLWPEWFSEGHFAQFKRIPRTWSALYQQVPASEEGDYFKSDCVQWYDKAPKHLHIYGASDYAVTDQGGDFTEHGVFGVDPNDDLYILDWWYDQSTADVWIDSLLDLIQRHKPLKWIGESGVIKRAVEPYMLKRMRERRVYCALDWMPSISDKPTRARGFQARWSMKKVYLPANQPWAVRLLSQLTRFPAGANDDAVDVCSLIGRALDDIFAAQGPQAPGKRDVGEDYGDWADEEEDSWKTV